jgi:radical SAM protein with 4Fe4S-binding SPASM domain
MNEFDNGLEDRWVYDMETPVDSCVSIEKIKKLVGPTDTLIFYGGEPLIMMEKIKKIMDNIDCRFVIQSNGILLNQLPTEYLLRFDKMLISIDGDSDRTNKNKGASKYKIITENLRDARSRGFRGEVVARMVITKSDLYEQVMHLIELIGDGLFDSIHWQIDAEFYKNDYDKKSFSKFVLEYNKSLNKLLKWWIAEIQNIAESKSGSWKSEERKGNKEKSECEKRSMVPKLYPFLGVLGRVMGWDTETRLPCGAGYANFTINTKGDLSACPIMNSVKDMYCGSLEDGITKEINCGGWCVGCKYLNVCGGRCLYSNNAQLWPYEGHKLVCDTITNLIDEIRRVSVDIQRFIDNGIVRINDFDFEKYFGPEIIP